LPEASDDAVAAVEERAGRKRPWSIASVLVSQLLLVTDLAARYVSGLVRIGSFRVIGHERISRSSTRDAAGRARRQVAAAETERQDGQEEQPVEAHHRRTPSSARAERVKCVAAPRMVASSPTHPITSTNAIVMISPSDQVDDGGGPGENIAVDHDGAAKTDDRDHRCGPSAAA
jgi:hypothetical protein